MDYNQKTIATYEQDLEEYAKYVDIEKRDYGWITRGLSGLPKTSRIFEIGSGMGIEADKIEQLGYSIQRSDATESFRNYMKDNGKESIKFNVKTDEFPGMYDVIIASAVLLHLNRDDFRGVLKKIASSLEPGGRFLFSVQKGVGEEWKENKGGPRFFCYWEKERLESELNDAGFVVNDINIFLDGKWLMVSAEKSYES